MSLYFSFLNSSLYSFKSTYNPLARCPPIQTAAQSNKISSTWSICSLIFVLIKFFLCHRSLFRIGSRPLYNNKQTIVLSHPSLFPLQEFSYNKPPPQHNVLNHPQDLRWRPSVLVSSTHTVTAWCLWAAPVSAAAPPEWHRPPGNSWSPPTADRPATALPSGRSTASASSTWAVGREGGERQGGRGGEGG